MKKLNFKEEQECLKFIRMFGNPVTTKISWFEKHFNPIDWFYLREFVYHAVKSGQVKE